jgi:hypothetical protein
LESGKNIDSIHTTGYFLKPAIQIGNSEILKYSFLKYRQAWCLEGADLSSVKVTTTNKFSLTRYKLEHC